MARKETNFKQTDIGLIPHDWEVEKLEDITSFPTSKIRSTDINVCTYISTDNMLQNNLGVLPFNGEVLPSNVREYKRGDILVSNIRPYLRKSYLATQSGGCSSDVIVFRPLGKIRSDYLHMCLSSSRYATEVTANSTGTKMPRGCLSFIRQFQVPLPTIEEQKRIAEVLSHFDEHIDNLVALLEKRKQVKAATMHALLSGTTRLPGFTQPWAETKLGDICEFRTGYTPSKSVRSFWENGTIPWFRMDDIRENGRKLLIAKQYVTEEAVKGGGLFEAGSFILATTATIGEHAWLIADSLANQRFTNLKIRKSLKNTLSAHFFFYYLYIIDEYCKRNTKTGTFAAVDIHDLKAFIIPTPMLKEQEAIADILSNMDRGIEALEEQVEKYRQMKEGAMEELLTGKVRLV